MKDPFQDTDWDGDEPENRPDDLQEPRRDSALAQLLESGLSQTSPRNPTLFLKSLESIQKAAENDQGQEDAAVEESTSGDDDPTPISRGRRNPGVAQRARVTPIHRMMLQGAGLLGLAASVAMILMHWPQSETKSAGRSRTVATNYPETAPPMTRQERSAVQNTVASQAQERRVPESKAAESRVSESQAPEIQAREMAAPVPSATENEKLLADEFFRRSNADANPPDLFNQTPRTLARADQVPAPEAAAAPAPQADSEPADQILQESRRARTEPMASAPASAAVSDAAHNPSKDQDSAQLRGSIGTDSPAEPAAVSQSVAAAPPAQGGEGQSTNPGGQRQLAGRSQNSPFFYSKELKSESSPVGRAITAARKRDSSQTLLYGGTLTTATLKLRDETTATEPLSTGTVIQRP